MFRSTKTLLSPQSKYLHPSFCCASTCYLNQADSRADSRFRNARFGGFAHFSRFHRAECASHILDIQEAPPELGDSCPQGLKPPSH